MSENFFIEPITNDTCAVVPNGAHDPFCEIDLIEEPLRKRGFQGTVVLDLLFLHGNEAQRFVAVPFVDGHLAQNKAYSLKDEAPELRKKSISYILKHLDALDFSVVDPLGNKNAKALFKAGFIPTF